MAAQASEPIADPEGGPGGPSGWPRHQLRPCTAGQACITCRPVMPSVTVDGAFSGGLDMRNVLLAAIAALSALAATPASANDECVTAGDEGFTNRSGFGANVQYSSQGGKWDSGIRCNPSGLSAFPCVVWVLPGRPGLGVVYRVRSFLAHRARRPHGRAHALTARHWAKGKLSGAEATAKAPR